MNYPEWFDVNLLELYKIKKEELVYLRDINGLASAYYESQFHKLHIPSIVITGISGVLSFIVSSDKVNNDKDIQFIITVIVGILTSISAILQSISTSLDSKTKSIVFRDAYDAYDNLITRVNFEIMNPDERNFITDLEKQIINIKSKVKYPIPNYISNKINTENTDSHIIKTANKCIADRDNLYDVRCLRVADDDHDTDV
jgi:hypothetical protein